MGKSLNEVSTSIYQRIRRDIIFGNLTPGSKLKLNELRKLYSASASTLRETLSRLASEGFVDALDQRGFFVTAVSNKDMIEIANLRILLECHALRLSMQSGDADWEGDVVSAHHKLHLMEQKMLSGDESEVERWKKYDWEFHKALIQACGSDNLLSLHSGLFDKYLRYQMLVMTYRGQEAVEEHQHLFEAALDRDLDRAEELLKTHIEKGLEHTLAAL